MNIEGGDAHSYSVPLRIVGMGSNIDEARFRAIRLARQEVARIVRATLLEMAGGSITPASSAKKRNSTNTSEAWRMPI